MYTHTCTDPLLIVLEYLPYGDLLGYLRKSRGHSDVYNSGEKTPTSSLSATDLLSFAWMIADGMEYLAKMKVSSKLDILICKLLSKGKIVVSSQLSVALVINNYHQHQRQTCNHHCHVIVKVIRYAVSQLNKTEDKYKSRITAVTMM